MQPAQVKSCSCTLLVQVYAAVKCEVHLVHAVKPPRVKGSRYTVELQPLGYSCRPATAAELCDALRAVLRALAALHHGGFVHRDVRWDNILRNSQASYSLMLGKALRGTIAPDRRGNVNRMSPLPIIPAHMCPRGADSCLARCL